MSLLKSCPGFLFLVFVQNLQIQGECPPSLRGEYSVKKAEKKTLKQLRSKLCLTRSCQLDISNFFAKCSPLPPCDPAELRSYPRKSWTI